MYAFMCRNLFGPGIKPNGFDSFVACLRYGSLKLDPFNCVQLFVFEVAIACCRVCFFVSSASCIFVSSFPFFVSVCPVLLDFLSSASPTTQATY